jgi:LPPG:FO 2-phospho-L-lactate transferase
VVAVSPIVAGAALKGPAAKIMLELGEEASSLGIARYYRGVIRTLLIDHSDAALAPRIRELGIEPVVTDAVMRTPADRARLARQCVDLARS